MKKNTKLKIIKRTGILILTGYLGITSFDKEYQSNNQEYSKEYEEFETQLNQLNNIKNIQIQNEELNNIINRRYTNLFTSKENINTLYIDTKLDNSNFSDLKYFQELENLTICNNTIDLKDLQYNQNLTSLTLINCTITNTSYLPNTIENLNIKNCTIEDNLIIPYFTKKVSLENISIHNIAFKNISILEELIIKGDIFIDLNILKDANNLNTLTIERCSNIKNASVLKELNIKNLFLDDYAPIWLTSDILNNINYTSNFQILEESKKLDTIANEIKNSNLSDEKKLEATINYVLENLTYDMRVYNKTDAANGLKKFYTIRPIEYVLTFEEGIYISYSTEFMALANRLGLNNYMLYSKDYTWNVVDNKEIDLVKMAFPEYQTPTLLPINEYPINPIEINDIGYIKNERILNITFNKQKFLVNLKTYAILLLIIELLYLLLKTKKTTKKLPNKQTKNNIDKEIDIILNDKLELKYKPKNKSKYKEIPTIEEILNEHVRKN